MISIDKREIKACCGRSQKIWTLSTPITKDFLNILQQAGFPFLSSFKDAGMLHAEDIGLVVSGVFGLKDLKIRCKNNNCAESLKKLEQIIISKLQVP